MEQENENEDKIINMSFLQKYFDWLTVQSKKKKLPSNVTMILIVDLGNVTQASRMIQGSMRLASLQISARRRTFVRQI